MQAHKIVFVEGSYISPASTALSGYMLLMFEDHARIWKIL